LSTAVAGAGGHRRAAGESGSGPAVAGQLSAPAAQSVPEDSLVCGDRGAAGHPSSHQQKTGQQDL
jgi:hypothetical protein